MTIFGILAIRIMLDSAHKEQTDHLRSIANEITNYNLASSSQEEIIDHINNYKNEFSREKLILIILRENKIIYILTQNSINNQLIDRIIQTRETGIENIIDIDDIQYVFSNRIIQNSGYELIFIKPLISLNHPHANTLIKRMATFGIIIIWLAIWAALVFGSIISRKLEEKNKQLRHQTLHDNLTKLPNRILLMDRLQQAQYNSHRQLSPFALIVMDLDNFKEINDTMGHHNGDKLLIEVSSRLLKSLRENDSLARLGGDEFAILLPDTDYNGAIVCTNRILHDIEEPLLLNETSIDIKASIGITLYPEHGDSIELILQHADVAMYQAKQLVGSSYSFYDPVQDSHSIRRLKLMANLRPAIENNLLSVNYQPMIDQNTNSIIGIEALARWNDKELGFIPPDEFIPLAEQTGSIQILTLWIIEKVAKDIKKWRSTGLNIKTAINISTNCLQDSLFPEKVEKIISNYGIPVSNIELEITESALMSDLKRARRILERLNEIGFIISIDDFGTGFSSLAYLKQLPVNILKIDRSFVQDMKHNKKDSDIVSTIIQLAHSLDCKVVAEGIEDSETYDLLKTLNNDIAQGYWISRPLTASDFEAWLKSSSWSNDTTTKAITNN